MATQAASANARADRQQARATDAIIASRIHSSAAAAHAQVQATLQLKMAGATLEIERLEDQVDDLIRQRSAILREYQILADENAALQARLH